MTVLYIFIQARVLINRILVFEVSACFSDKFNTNSDLFCEKDNEEWFTRHKSLQQMKRKKVSNMLPWVGLEPTTSRKDQSWAVVKVKKAHRLNRYATTLKTKIPKFDMAFE